jgi:lipoprotein signal peptidase
MIRDNSALASGIGGRRQPVSDPQWTMIALAMVIVVDQGSKWWAWRQVTHVRINFGGDPLVGATVGAWYADPVTGALLDLLGAGVLAVAMLTFLRRRHPVLVRTPAALAIGGWISNLLDRLGMHRLTAPGSVRGAIDFVHIGPYYFNVADFFIIGATLVFLLAHAYHWTTVKLARTSPSTPRARSRPRVPAWIATVSGVVVLVTAVTLGAAHYGGITAPLTSIRTSTYW